jgi:multiple sugar transport system permease protein
MSRRLDQVNTWQGIAYLFPATAIFALAVVIPAIFVFVISFSNYNLLSSGAAHFVGLSNYAQVFSNAQFWDSLLATLYFTLGTVPTGTLVALLIALALMKRFPGQSLVRLAVYSPYVTPVVASSIIWIWILNPQFGVLNGLLHAVGLPELGWLQSPTWAMPGVVMFTLWHGLGFNVVIFMAGLSTVSAELREAARVDGANAWQEFKNVVWPLLSPTTLFVLIITTITSLQAFTQFYTMTQGGPIGVTTTTSYLLYEQAFLFFHTSYAAALAVLLFLIIVGLTLLQMRASRARTVYQ